MGGRFGGSSLVAFQQLSYLSGRLPNRQDLQGVWLNILVYGLQKDLAKDLIYHPRAAIKGCQAIRSLSRHFDNLIKKGSEFLEIFELFHRDLDRFRFEPEGPSEKVTRFSICNQS